MVQYILHVHAELMRPGLALVETGPAHWMTSFTTSRPVCVFIAKVRELWFNDVFMYIGIGILG